MDETERIFECKWSDLISNKLFSLKSRPSSDRSDNEPFQLRNRMREDAKAVDFVFRLMFRFLFDNEYIANQISFRRNGVFFFWSRLTQNLCENAVLHNFIHMRVHKFSNHSPQIIASVRNENNKKKNEEIFQYFFVSFSLIFFLLTAHKFTFTHKIKLFSLDDWMW